MLKRISSIKGIGPYTNCNAGAVEFRKTSLVFGNNSYGKSTLCEVLRSLESGDTSEIGVRGTIPGPIPQIATLTFAEDGKPELPVTLQNTKWTPSTPGPFKFQVFDSGFVVRNLFASTHADRANKEALSRFVLGEQGVNRSNEIVDMRKRQAATKAAWRKLLLQLNSVGDVDAFAKMEVSKSEVELKEELQPFVVALSQAKTRLASVQKIQSRQLLTPLRLTGEDTIEFEKLNAALVQSLSTTHETARRKMEEHVQQHMKGQRSASDWIRQGLDYMSGQQCPFCEQSLENSPQGLIESYGQYFDESFRSQSQAIYSALSVFEYTAKLRAIPAYEAQLKNNTIVLLEYRELEDNETFKLNRVTLDELAQATTAAFSLVESDTRRLFGLAYLSIVRKRDAIHEAIAPLDLTEYRTICESATQAINKFNEHCIAINEVLSAFKLNSDKAALEAEVTRLVADVELKQLQLHRVVSAVACDDYIKARKLDSELDKSIKDAEEALTMEQSTYLATFFERINGYFTKFGTRHFTIGTAEKLDMQGYQPVLSLIVKYHGIEIAPQNLGSVFSESDRRALALSIFWAKLSILSKAEREVTIAVLDDPVTSFDDNRISSAVMQMRLEATTLRQLVLFTHYHAFVRHWLNVEHASGTMSFHQLTRNDVTTSLTHGDPETFLHSEQQKLFQKFIDFIAGKSQEPIGMELRVYLENEIRDRYRQQLAIDGMKASTLSDVINHLAAKGAISGDVAKKAHYFREDLNAPHHVPTVRAREDWSNIASEMLNFIYKEL